MTLFGGDQLKTLKCIIPNLITLTNLSLGVIAILLSVSNQSLSNMINSSLLIMLAAVTDRLDGKVARMFRVTSDLGKELDSLSDLISFGVAPVIVAWKISFTGFGALGYILVLMFSIAGAYRLARFNITAFDNVFRGVPITVAGAFVTIINLYNCFAILNNRYSSLNSILTALIVIVLSFFMVSKLRIKKV